MPKYFLPIIFIILLTGCKKQIVSEPNFPVKTQVKADTIKPPVISDVYEGVYTDNINTQSFRDCRYPDSVYWVIDNTKKLGASYKKIFAVPNVYNSVFARVRGEFEPTKDETTKEKYPKTLRVKEVLAVEKKNSTNTCIPYDYWAFGNDPAWSLQISRSENLIEFILPAENKTYYFFYDDPSQENGYTIYSNYNKIQSYDIAIKIKKERCTGKSSDEVFDYSAQVEVTGGRKFTGCALKGKAEQR